jgi:hypothetical protein
VCVDLGKVVELACGFKFCFTVSIDGIIVRLRKEGYDLVW